MTFARLIFYKNITEKYYNALILRKISTTNYCIETIRKHDYENFICTLLLKSEVRASAIAIRAFNVEIARLQDQVSNSEIGVMRFKFWEDAIEKCFLKTNKTIANHPVVFELDRVLHKNKFTKRHFLYLISSRKEIMLNNIFDNIEHMENYAEKSVSSVYYLLLESSKVRDVHADHAASHLGKAQGLCQLLRGVPLCKQINMVALPQTLLLENKVSYEDVIRRRKLDQIKEITFKVATRANQHLEKARSLSDKLSPDARAVLLPATLVHNYLQLLLRLDCDLFHNKLLARNYMWIPALWLKRLLNSY